jgi:hypothetical protein
MRSVQSAALGAVLGAVIAIACLPTAASAIDVFKFTGTATDIGIQRGPNQVGGVEFRIQGNFQYHGPIDLSRATATFHELFVEAGPGGTGELIKMMNAANFLPITLALRDGDVDEAVFITDSRFRPQMRFQVENTNGVFDFKLRLDRGLARLQPRLCTLDATGRKQFTVMTNSFTIADGVNPPVDITIAVPWQCALGGFQMRTP